MRREFVHKNREHYEALVERLIDAGYGAGSRDRHPSTGEIRLRHSDGSVARCFPDREDGTHHVYVYPPEGATTPAAFRTRTISVTAAGSQEPAEGDEAPATATRTDEDSDADRNADDSESE